jgi:ABC-2 type transport system permease protein
MSPLYKIALKDLKLLIRDKSGFFFTFFFPFIVAVLFGFIFSTGGGGTGTMSVLLVDDDNTPASRKFIEVLQNASEINVIQSDLDNTRNLVRTGKVVAYLRIQKGFGEAYQRLFYGDPPELEVGVDPSRRPESAMLEGILMKYGSRRFQDLFIDTAAMKRNIDLYREDIESDAGMEPVLKEDLGQLMGDLDRFYSVLPQEDASGKQAGAGQAESADEAGPVFTPLKVTMSEVRRIRTGPSNSFEVTFPQGMIWGIIGVAAAFGISIVVERTRGTLQRLRIAPIGIAHILAGKAIACMVSRQ